ncbi:penicillin acylase family protein [Rhodoferax saidenbachensis]|uniref:Penicillin acylase family protein n=1 Tax=Rhodoferax saidenbachensis TaxID=1484693 RepID=A0A1P8K920_9BURK|nr:penicillin acylase family protein [Rhodoferax saidenbachensis]APW42494.1 penicillin acylase family protein [Rhodoferax saidenbachensis]
MKRVLKTAATVLLTVGLLAVAAGGWYLHGKQPQRSGSVQIPGMLAEVTVRYDERGVPHIQAQNEADMYRALGYVQAQDRLFQMEMIRRLARGQLAEILGPDLLEVDRLFRTLGIDAHARKTAAAMDTSSHTSQALKAYLEGVNTFQDSHPAPLEFDILGIPKRPFTAEDTFAVSGYLAYSFAAAFKTEPLLTYVRDTLGADYLKTFDVDWHPKGMLPLALNQQDWQGLGKLAALSQRATDLLGTPQFMGSNAWAISGSRTASGKPLLAGDPHIGFSAPAVWYEAHLSAPGFELYGHHQPLTPVALLGHNSQFGWSLTMFENDDIDLVAEKVNPANPNQVWVHGGWVDLQTQEDTILVKGAEPVKLLLRRSPHGPIINDALGKESAGTAPIAMWWAFLETPNPILDAFYALHRADTLSKARMASSQIHAPGLNIVWANAAGDIGWWAAAKIPHRPAGVNPAFILDGSKPESDKPGFFPFSDNPQEENPTRGYIVSANHQPLSPTGIAIPGYYLPPDRVQRLDQLLQQPGVKWDTKNSQALQLDVHTNYGPRILQSLLPVLQEVVTDSADKALLQQLATWDGDYRVDAVAPTLYFQLLYAVAHSAFADELGEERFGALRQTYALDYALERLAATPASPWWDNRATTQKESRADTVKTAWTATLAHLRKEFGTNTAQWTWGRAHTLTHGHPLGMQKPLDKLFNVGPFAAPGGHEVPNNLSTNIGPAPWAVTDGPSTRRLIDFANPAAALGINPVGQSGVLFDKHYADQAATYVAGGYVPQYLQESDVAAATQSTLTLQPAR